MNTRHALVLASLFAAVACNPFHREPASEVRPDANVNSRWRASLVSPAALAGAVQIKGSGSMQPTGNGEGTLLSVSTVMSWLAAFSSLAWSRTLAGGGLRIRACRRPSTSTTSLECRHRR